MEKSKEVNELKLEKLVTKLPLHIKQYYIKTAKKFGQKTAPYASLILIQHAIDNGATDKKIKS